MKVNTVDFSGGHIPSRAMQLHPKRKQPQINYDKPIHVKSADIIPITGLLGASLMSVYFIKKGNLDIAMKALHI